MTSPMHSPLQSPLQPVMRSPLEFRRRGGFNIASTNPSAYYDRSVLASMFQDSAGTIAIPDSGYSIGYGGDLSGGSNNQIQATAGKRPILMQSPVGGVRNRLTYTEDLTNANWVKTGATASAHSITTTATTSSHRAVQSASVVVGTNSLTVRAKANGYNFLQLRVNGEGSDTGSAVGNSFCFFNLSSGSIGSSGGGTINSISSAGDGYYDCTMKYTGVGAGTVSQQICVYNIDTGVAFTSWLADGVGGLLIQRVQTENGGPSSYQKVTNAYTVTEAGVPSVWRAKFDAVDDDLGTTFGASLGAGCTVCRSLPGTGASITTGVTLTATYTDNVDAHALLIYTAAQWAALDAGKIAKITAWLNAKAGV